MKKLPPLTVTWQIAIGVHLVPGNEPPMISAGPPDAPSGEPRDSYPTAINITSARFVCTDWKSSHLQVDQRWRCETVGVADPVRGVGRMRPFKSEKI